MLYMLMAENMNWFECTTDTDPFEIMEIVHRAIKNSKTKTC
jgi:hypothetical protein